VIRVAIRWCAIEAYDKRVFSASSDVWAFGVTLWEIMSYGAKPYSAVEPKEVRRKVREGLRLAKPRGCPAEVFQMLTGCFAVDPSERPTFMALRAEIQMYLRNASQKEGSRDVALVARSM